MPAFVFLFADCIGQSAAPALVSCGLEGASCATAPAYQSGCCSQEAPIQEGGCTLVPVHAKMHWSLLVLLHSKRGLYMMHLDSLKPHGEFQR